MSERLTFDQQGRVSSIQRLAIDAPHLQPYVGSAHRWMDAYWRLVQRATLGLVVIHSDTEGLTLRLRWFKIPLLAFGTPWLLETDRFVVWGLALKGGVLNGGNGGYLVCAAEQLADGRWHCTMMLRDFTPRLARFYPVPLWKLVYSYTQAFIHHLLGVVYLWQRGREITRNCYALPHHSV